MQKTGDAVKEKPFRTKGLSRSMGWKTSKNRWQRSSTGLWIPTKDSTLRLACAMHAHAWL